MPKQMDIESDSSPMHPAQNHPHLEAMQAEFVSVPLSGVQKKICPCPQELLHWRPLPTIALHEIVFARPSDPPPSLPPPLPPLKLKTNPTMIPRNATRLRSCAPVWSQACVWLAASPPPPAQSPSPPPPAARREPSQSLSLAAPRPILLRRRDGSRTTRRRRWRRIAGIATMRRVVAGTGTGAVSPNMRSRALPQFLSICAR